jgi:hypothetical protein
MRPPPEKDDAAPVGDDVVPDSRKDLVMATLASAVRKEWNRYLTVNAVHDPHDLDGDDLVAWHLEELVTWHLLQRVVRGIAPWAEKHDCEEAAARYAEELRDPRVTTPDRVETLRGYLDTEVPGPVHRAFREAFNTTGIPNFRLFDIRRPE